MDKIGAIKAAKNGAIAATITGCLTLAVVVFASYSNADADLALWDDPFSVFDAVLAFACAWGMYRKSRAAAVVIFVYFIFSKINIGISIGRIPGLSVALIFLYYYGRAIQGTFAFHRLEKAENPDYRPPPRWYAFIGIPVGLSAIALMSFGTLSMTGAIPSTQVLVGDKLPKNEIETLLSEGIIDEGEVIEYFYSAGITSILEDGNLLTDRRVISYFTNDRSELEVYELFIGDIRSVELVQEGNYLNDSIYQVNSYDKDAWVQILLSKEARGDIRFIESLRNKIDRSL